MSLIVPIADAVKAALEAATFSLPFTVERVYVPVHQLEELSEIRVSVVAGPVSSERLGRGTARQRDYSIDLGIQRRAVATREECDPLVHLVEEIDEFWFNRPLAMPEGGVAATCFASQIKVPYDLGHLDTERVFTAVIQLTIRVVV